MGNGIAGNAVAFSIRKKNRDHQITILSAEKFPEYDPCSLPYFVGGEVPWNVVFRKTKKDYRANHVALVCDSKVVSIAAPAKKVITEKGDEYPYDKLVLAPKN